MARAKPRFSAPCSTVTLERAATASPVPSSEALSCTTTDNWTFCALPSSFCSDATVRSRLFQVTTPTSTRSGCVASTRSTGTRPGLHVKARTTSRRARVRLCTSRLCGAALRRGSYAAASQATRAPSSRRRTSAKSRSADPAARRTRLRSGCPSTRGCAALDPASRCLSRRRG